MKASYFPALPEEVLPLLTTGNLSSFTVRDLPYSFDFLVENFMDPAHIPFAHHSLQVRRSRSLPPRAAGRSKNKSILLSAPPSNRFLGAHLDPSPGHGRASAPTPFPHTYPACRTLLHRRPVRSASDATDDAPGPPT